MESCGEPLISVHFDTKKGVLTDAFVALMEGVSDRIIELLKGFYELKIGLK